MIEDQLLQYGALGLFTIYLIYDRQVVIKGVVNALNGLTTAINERFK